MKKVLLGLVMVAGHVIFGVGEASAEIRSQVALREMELSPNGILTFSYQVSGGCEEHEAALDIELQEQKENEILIAEIKIQDVTQKPDLCEAFVVVSSSVDLRLKLREALSTAQKSLDQRVHIRLPIATIYPQ